MINKLLKNAFNSNNKALKKYKHNIIAINSLEQEYQKFSDEQLKAKTAEFRNRFDNGESLDSLLVESFATVREAAVRTLEMKHYDVQLIGGIVLHQGKIAEMKTGEGKTLMSTLPSYLNGLTGNGVHIVTVNEYLAKRDAEWMGIIHNFLGLTVDVVYSGMSPKEKKDAYNADITYGVNNEFGFDYLKDNMKHSYSDLSQRSHSYAIIDEIDSILIDEARTPLIISGPAEDSTELYKKTNSIATEFKVEKDFLVELKSKQLTLTEEGIAKGEKLLNINNLYDPENIELVHHLQQSLRAHNIMQKNIDYIIKSGEVIIVDEFTGRLMPGRRWSDGLHQSVEAKEKVQIQKENQTLASITFQNLFRLYDKLSGMTGTAVTEAPEFKEIYNLDVVVIPTNKPLIREDFADVIYKDKNDKYNAVADDVKELNTEGRPVLVGTVNIEQSEELSELLKKRNIDHTVLNAKFHKDEASIVAQAGRYKGVTIATNMAGRGTDIVLGGNPEGLTIQELGYKDYEKQEFVDKLNSYKDLCTNEKEKVINAGGLAILGTERHESRRIDNQLRGRAGRQGDPGMSRFYISLEDDLMLRFGGDKLQSIMGKVGWKPGTNIESSIISRQIENAQSKVERYHFESRKHVTEYDDVMNQQRKTIYRLRNQILKKEEIANILIEFMEDTLETAVLNICNTNVKSHNWKLDELENFYKNIFLKEFKFPEESFSSQQAVFDEIRTAAKNEFQTKRTLLEKALGELKEDFKAFNSENNEELEFSDFDYELSSLEQITILEVIDHEWNDHLQAMDYLKEGINLRGYAQKNPLHEYQNEGFKLFNDMFNKVKINSVARFFNTDENGFKLLLEQVKEERKRRKEIEAQIEFSHQAEREKDAIKQKKSASSAKNKLAEQKKARRRK